jgi:hypothetical protein
MALGEAQVIAATKQALADAGGGAAEGSLSQGSLELLACSALPSGPWKAGTLVWLEQLHAHSKLVNLGDVRVPRARTALARPGVSVEALERAAAAGGSAAGSRAVARSPSALLVKNLPYR